MTRVYHQVLWFLYHILVVTDGSLVVLLSCPAQTEMLSSGVQTFRNPKNQASYGMWTLTCHYWFHVSPSDCTRQRHEAIRGKLVAAPISRSLNSSNKQTPLRWWSTRSAPGTLSGTFANTSAKIHRHLRRRAHVGTSATMERS